MDGAKNQFNAGKFEETYSSTPLPQYQCHKKVWALKLADVIPDNGSGFGLLIPEHDGRFAPFKVDAAWIAKNKIIRQPDGSYGYYVLYQDGYKSWSPSKAFEEGYTLIG